MKERAKQLKASGQWKKPEKKAAPAPGATEAKPKKTKEKKPKEKKRKSDASAPPPAKKQKVADDKGLVFPVLVRGLGEVSVADLKDVFSECGETASVKISGGGKAIVTFASRDAAAMALKLHGEEMDGGVIKVSKLPPEPAAAAAAAAPAAPAEPDDGFSLSVCINQVPDEASIEEISTACEAFGAVTKVNCDKKP